MALSSLVYRFRPPLSCAIGIFFTARCVWKRPPVMQVCRKTWPCPPLPTARFSVRQRSSRRGVAGGASGSSIRWMSSYFRGNEVMRRFARTALARSSSIMAFDDVQIRPGRGKKAYRPSWRREESNDTPCGQMATGRAECVAVLRLACRPRGIGLSRIVPSMTANQIVGYVRRPDPAVSQFSRCRLIFAVHPPVLADRCSRIG